MLKKGSVLRAKLIEAVGENQWIVSFQGQLLQVRNGTDIKFKEGLLLNVQVVRENPLQLKILTHKNYNLKIDVVA